MICGALVWVLKPGGKPGRVGWVVPVMVGVVVSVWVGVVVRVAVCVLISTVGVTVAFGAALAPIENLTRKPINRIAPQIIMIQVKQSK